MKKLSLLIVLLVLSFSTLFSAPVDTTTSQLIATNFYRSRVQTTGSRSIAPAQLVYTSKIKMSPRRDSIACFYIYNIEGGFVIVSADDRFEPVLGYSLDGNFQPSEMPPALREFLQDYQEQMRSALDAEVPSYDNVLQKWSKLSSRNHQPTRYGTSIVEPLISTTWDQGDYYNDLCPVDIAGVNGHAYTGCVATAMAQILRYWEYPIHGEGSHSYIHPDYGVLSADFASATYDYSNMPNSLDSNSTPEEVFQVAQLLYHYGVSIDMDYGTNQSPGGFSSSSMNTYFGYSGCYGAWRYSYSDNEWINLLKSSLNNLQPIPYSGDPNDHNQCGHAFICDGYDNENFFHINWGWGGRYDGYYLLSALSPGSPVNNYGYNFNHYAILGISPSIPYIRTNKKSISYIAEYGNLSEGRLVTVRTNNLTSPVIASVTGSFQISTDSIHYYSTVMIDSFGGQVFVRYIPSANEITEHGTLSLSSDSTSFEVPLVGRSYTATCAPPENLMISSQDLEHITLQWDTVSPDQYQQMLSWGSGNFSHSYGYASDYSTSIVHRYCDSDLVKYHGKSLTAIDLYVLPGTSLCKALVFKGGGTHNGYIYEQGNLVLEQTIDLSSLIPNAWNTITLDTPVEIDANQELWFGFYLEAPGGNLVIPLTDDCVTGKNDIIADYSETGDYTWHSYNYGTTWGFCIKGKVADRHALTHYEVYRDSLFLGNTNSLSWHDTLNASETCSYTVVASWSNGCKASAQQIFTNVTQISTTPETLNFYTKYGFNNKVQSILVKGNGLTSNIQATASGHFLISTDSDIFSSSASLNWSGGTLYVNYVPDSANTSFETGNIHLQSGDVSANVLLTGQCHEICNPPKNLTLSQTDNQIDLYWNAPELYVPDQYELTWCTNVSYTYNNDTETKMYMMHRFEPSDLTDYHNKLLTAISFIPSPSATIYKLVVYKGGSYDGNSFHSGTSIVQQYVNLSTLTCDEWNTIMLDNPVVINANEELWYGVYMSATAGNDILKVGFPYIPNKGSITKILAPFQSGWTEYSPVFSFPLKAIVEDSPRLCTHYQIDRDDEWLGATTQNYYTDYPLFNGLKKYTVWSVWDNGCKAYTKDTFQVRDLCNLPGASSTVEVCDNYIWNGTSYSNSGTYYYISLDSGCTQIDTLYLTVNSLPTIAISGETTFCEGSGTILAASGGSSYVWSDLSNEQSLYVSTPGLYSVTGTDDNGCANIANVSVDMLSSTHSEFTVENMGSFSWNGITYTSSGDYTQIFSDSNGCDSVVTLHLTITAGLPEYATPGFEVFPNPTTNFIQVLVLFPCDQWTIYVYDVFGRLLNQTTATGKQTIIDLTPYSRGMYTIIVKDEQQQFLGTSKVLKK